MGASDIHYQTWRDIQIQPVLFVLVLNLVSAALFIGFVNRPFYDDIYNIVDVHHYATEGFSRESVVTQKNAPGPTSFAWMAAAVRIIGGNELRDARVGALISWVLLGTVLLLGARYGRFPELWYAALLTLLVFPHAVEAAATVLTEGPALFFALVGALAWTEFVARTDLRPRVFLFGMVGCFSMGVAVTCRQYNMALLPAAAFLAAVPILKNAWSPGEKQRWTLRAAFCLVLSAVPVLLLVLAWKGISSPGIQSGTSYNMVYKAGAGLSFMRPVIAALYIGLYLLPFTFPLMKRMKPTRRWRALAVSAAGGIVAARFSASLLQPGPLNSLVKAAARFPYGAKIALSLIVAGTIYNAIVLCLAVWESRKALLLSTPAVFAILTVLFFLLEQFGVGGNIPFYDRYILQVAPFFGVIAFALLPRLDNARLAALISLSVLSHVMLWRYVFIR
jgi:hypothetical protein